MAANDNTEYSTTTLRPIVTVAYELEPLIALLSRARHAISLLLFPVISPICFVFHYIRVTFGQVIIAPLSALRRLIVRLILNILADVLSFLKGIVRCCCCCGQTKDEEEEAKKEQNEERTVFSCSCIFSAIFSPIRAYIHKKRSALNEWFWNSPNFLAYCLHVCIPFTRPLTLASRTKRERRIYNERRNRAIVTLVVFLALTAGVCMYLASYLPFWHYHTQRVIVSQPAPGKPKANYAYEEVQAGFREICKMQSSDAQARWECNPLNSKSLFQSSLPIPRHLPRLVKRDRAVGGRG